MVNGLVAVAQSEPTISRRHVDEHIEEEASHNTRKDRGANRHASGNADRRLYMMWRPRRESIVAYMGGCGWSPEVCATAQVMCREFNTIRP
jgi:hypothetical protein